jgi:hypothetical protein
MKKSKRKDINKKIEKKIRKKDAEWREWCESPESIFDILKNPKLGAKPSERYTALERLAESISHLKPPALPIDNKWQVCYNTVCKRIIL